MQSHFHVKPNLCLCKDNLGSRLGSDEISVPHAKGITLPRCHNNAF